MGKLFESFYLQKCITNTSGTVLFLLKLQVSNVQVIQDDLSRATTKMELFLK